jgi:hypothetical protein
VLLLGKGFKNLKTSGLRRLERFGRFGRLERFEQQGAEPADSCPEKARSIAANGWFA